MQLFKRVLLSIFPDDIVNQSVNPASMFISFISTKEFFSVINRKIVENYKLNLFDVTQDPFEFKIGFGENIPIKPKDVDLYYGYAATANLNGYRFFSPANIANSLSLVSALYVKDIFWKYDPEYYLHFLYTIFLLHFVFLSRMKIFPSQDKERNYNWFVDVFFSFYAFVFQQTGQTPDPKKLLEIKKAVLNTTEIFFVLFAVYQRLNTTFLYSKVTDKDIYAWLFHDELKGEDTRKSFADFVGHYQQYAYSSDFTALEGKILHHVLPADILLRYLFLESDMSLMTETVVAKLFDKKILDEFVVRFRKDDSALESFLLYITDYRHFKKKFFQWVQKYIITLFKDEDQWMIGEDLDDLMSSIGEDVESIDSFKVPERIKKESKLMEKILNFYITFIWWFRVSRGDNFFLRLFKYPLIQKVMTVIDSLGEKNYTLMYYGALLDQYRTNVFYYRYTADNVRAGKQKFILPNKSDNAKLAPNISLLKSFDVNSLAIILQDINPKDIRIYLKHKKILDLFRALLGKQVSDLVTSKKQIFLDGVYGSIAQHLVDFKDFVKDIKGAFTDQDIFHLKENIYNIDYRVSQTFYQHLHGAKVALHVNYSDITILGIFAQVRETLFGFLLYMTFSVKKKPARNSSMQIGLPSYISSRSSISMMTMQTKLLKS